MLHRPIGGREVMRAQLAPLLEFTGHRWMRVQVLPFSAGEHASLAGSFNALRFDDEPDIVYTEDLISGRMTANPETIREAARRYAHLQESAALIARVLEERYGDQPEQVA